LDHREKSDLQDLRGRKEFRVPWVLKALRETQDQQVRKERKGYKVK